MNDNQSALKSGLSVLGKLFVGTRKGTSGERARLLRNCQRAIGVRFTDLSLLEQALTHRSYSHVTSQTRIDSNERMEFLGDSVLGLAVSQFLYLEFPERSEGALSKMKSLLVSRKVLSTVARDCGLGEYLLLSGEESEMGGRDRASILADSFEGVIGAIYLDQGYRAANRFIQRTLLASIHSILEDDEHTNYKSLLQEHVQSRRLSHPVYRVRREEGPEHEKEFAIDVVVKGQVWGTGRGKSKKDAEQAAARAALESRMGSGGKSPRRRSERGERGERKTRSGRSVRAEPEASRVTPAAEAKKPDRSAESRTTRSRGRARPEDVPESAEARDRGGHGVAASRETLRRSRKEEEQKGRVRRRTGTRADAAPAPETRDKTTPPSGETGRSSGRRRSRRRRSTQPEAERVKSGSRGGGGRDERGPAETPEPVERRDERVERRDERVEQRAERAEQRAEPVERRAEPVPAPRTSTEPGNAEGTGFARRRRRSERRSRPDAEPSASRASVRTEDPAGSSEVRGRVVSAPDEAAPRDRPEKAVSSEAAGEVEQPGQKAPDRPIAPADEPEVGGKHTGSFSRRKRRSVRGLRRR